MIYFFVFLDLLSFEGSRVVDIRSQGDNLVAPFTSLASLDNSRATNF